jgi:Phage tail tube protein
MTIATTSRAQLRRIPEVTFGTTPVTGNGWNLRVTGESFNFDVKKEMSKELRADRQIGYAVPVSAGASGGFTFHLNYGEYDPEIESVLQGTWAVYGTNGVGTTFTADFTTTTITASVAPTGLNAFTTLQKGQWFRLLAPSHANNGLVFRVSPTTAPTSTIITLDAATPATAGTAIALCAVQTSRVSNGTVQTSFSYEKEFPDVAQVFVFRGMTPGKLSLNFASAALTDGSIEFMGKNSVRGTATFMPGTAVASRTYEIMNGASGVGQLYEAGVALTTTFIKSLALTVDNVQRSQEAIGTLGYVGIGSGTVQVKATMEVYFSDGSLYDKFIANTYTSLTVGSMDTSGNGYVLSLPRVNIMSGKIVAGSKDTDLMASFEVMALADDANATVALRKTIFIDRFGVALAPL